MGYCQLLTFRDGKLQDGIELRNPWRGVPYIWDSLFDRYLKSPDIPYDSWLMRYQKDKGESLWNLAKRSELPLFERATHAFTFDLAYVRREHFYSLARDLREFSKRYPVDYPTHLPEWAKLLDGLEAEAVGLYGTSVSENPWNKYDDSMIATSLSDGFEVYEWIAGMDAKKLL